MAFTAVVELASLDGSNGFKLTGVSPGDFAGLAVSAAGDVNGDGYADVLVGAWMAKPNGVTSGAAYVVFGKAGGFSAVSGLGVLTGADGFRISQSVSGVDGFAVAAADINGDGYSDLIIGDRWGNGNMGEAHVIFGKAGGFSANVDPSALNGTDGFRLSGDLAGGQAGRAVATAGDINGDGYDDFLVSAPYASTSVGQFAGVTYLVFGKASGFSAIGSLGDLNGTDGFRINAAGEVTQTGFALAGGGDVNGDGFDDLIIGAPTEQGPEFRTGMTYVIYGKAGGFGASLELAQLTAADGFSIRGEAIRTDSGFSVGNAGDLNGDGLDDVILGAPNTDANGVNSGAAFVVFGSAAGANLKVSDLNGANGFRIVGDAAGDYAGWAVNGAGDVNGDGLQDLIVSGPQADPNGDLSGAAWVMFGRTTGFNAVINLSRLNGVNGFEIRGPSAGNGSGSAVSSAGDVNNDGFDDLLVGAKDDGQHNGAAYVIFGQAAMALNLQVGSAGANRISGGFGHDRVLGLDGNDNLSGAFGDDLLEGGDGVDKLFGYDGDDTLLGGAGNDQIYGEIGDDILNGGGNNDLLDGGTGADTMWGGDGNDVFLVDDLGDHTNEGLFEGYDIVRTALTWTLGDNIEQLELLGSADVDGTGNIWGNKLYGNAGDNRLDGDLGVDTINGGDGDDIVIGGLDNDLLRGGTGADTFLVAHGFSVILETDQVFDFSTAEGDIIDLSGLDAIAGGADDAFTLVSGFTKHAGEMTLTFAGGITSLKLDITGDGKVDYQMKINGDVTGDSAGWLL